MSSRRGRKAAPVESPVLTIEQVSSLLEDEIADLGAWGASIGGSLGGGSAGAAGGRSGGGQGARFGARHLMKLDGEHRARPLSRTGEGLERLRAYFGESLREKTSEDGSDAVLMVGCVGVGVGGLSPVVVQAVWYPAEVQMTAHAREGLIKTHQCRKALDRLETVVGTRSDG